MGFRTWYTALVGKRQTIAYQTLPYSDTEADEDGPVISRQSDPSIIRDVRRRILMLGSCVVVVVLLIYWAVIGSYHNIPELCDSTTRGYQCEPELSHSWGQYSPFFAVPAEISSAIPPSCSVVSAIVLSRHGARDPTSGMSSIYRSLIDRIHANTTSYSSAYRFLADYHYTLGSDQLSTFGEQELVNSGIAFYERYADLTRHHHPFIRAGAQERVVQSARNFSQGFHQAKAHDGTSGDGDSYPYDILAIREGTDSNNTLSMETCPAFDTSAEREAQAAWLGKFIPAVSERVHENLAGVELTDRDVLHLMDLCPFETVAHPRGTISPFCRLFTLEEWRDYDYYHTLGKYYGYSRGSGLAPSMGVGWVNELIARLTNTSVHDHTTTNSTLDADPKTFPLGLPLYADFSHDNDMQMIFAALGLFNDTASPEPSHRMSREVMGGFGAATTVPFAARLYVEKLVCHDGEGSKSSESAGHGQDFVRVLLNNRVMPLRTCGADELGRCRLDDFVESLGFARNGGHWDDCFK